MTENLKISFNNDVEGKKLSNLNGSDEENGSKWLLDDKDVKDRELSIIQSGNRLGPWSSRWYF